MRIEPWSGCCPGCFGNVKRFWNEIDEENKNNSCWLFSSIKATIAARKCPTSRTVLKWFTIIIMWILGFLGFVSALSLGLAGIFMMIFGIAYGFYLGTVGGILGSSIAILFLIGSLIPFLALCPCCPQDVQEHFKRELKLNEKEISKV